MAVDYSAGGGNMGQLYTNLQNALANRGAAENLRAERDIERKGLFGTGIRTSDIRDLTSAGLTVAEFGQKRMEGQMDRATKSFERRQGADERRLATLQDRFEKKMLDAEGIKEMKGIQMGMTERRNSFEDTLSKYQDKGLWGSGFGSDEVGYRTEGESKYSLAEKEKGRKHRLLQDANKGFDPPPMSDFKRSPSQPDIDQKLSGHRKIGENAPIGPEGLNARMKREYLERKKLRAQAAPDRSQYFPGADSGDGSYKPEPYNRYKDGMMSLEPLDFSNDLLSPGQRQGVKDLGYRG